MANLSTILSNTSSGGATVSQEKNYIRSPDSASNLWVASGGGIAVSTETAAANLPEAATKTSAIKFLRASGSDYVRCRFTLDSTDYSKKLKLAFGMIYAGTLGDYTVSVYSNTASDYSGTSTQLSLPNSSLGPLFTSFATTFDATGSTAPYLEVRINGIAGTSPLYISGMVVGPGALVQGAAISSPQAITFTGTWIANTTYTAFETRIGSLAKYDIKISLTGAPTTANLNLTMPTGRTIDTAAMANSTSSAGNILPNISLGILDAGTSAYTGTAAYLSSTTISLFYSTGTAPSFSFNNITQATPFTFASGDTITLSFIVPIAEWAGSGTVLLGPGAAVEYAWNSDTTDTSTTGSGFSYGPGGVAFGSFTTANRFKRVRFQYPIQQTDEIILEVFDATGSQWVPAASSLGVSLSNSTGMSLQTVSSTDVEVIFGSAGYGATTRSSAGVWSGIVGAGWKWRVKKVNPSTPVGISAATQDTLGLIKLSQISGAGEKNYLSTGSSDSTGWAASAAGVGISTETSTANLPENSTKTTALKILRASGSDYARYRFTLDVADYGKKLKIFWNQKYAGTAGDYTVTVFSNTLADYTGTSTALVTSTTNVPALDGSNTITFDASNGTAPYLEVRINGIAGTTALYLSGIVVGPGTVTQGAAVSGWQSQTFAIPTNLGAGSGTVTSYSKRNGDSLEVVLQFVKDGTPGSGASTVTFAMPSGYTINSALLPSTGRIGYGSLENANYNPNSDVTANSSTTFTITKPSTAVPITGADLTAATRLHLRLFIPINEWAGNGTVNLGAGAQVEYAFNTSTATAANDTTSFAYGPQGAQIKAITAGLRRRVRFQYPIQSDDVVTVELSNDQVKWSDAAYGFTDNSTFTICPFNYQGTTYGVGNLAIINATDVDVQFGTYTLPTATYNAAGSAWGVTAGNVYWRVRKAKASNPTGFGVAGTDGSAGLYKPGSAPGLVTGATIPAGMIGERITGSQLSPALTTATRATVSQISITPGVWLVCASVGVTGGAVTGTRVYGELATAANGSGGFGICDGPSVPTASADVRMQMTGYISVSVNTIVFCNVICSFTGGSPMGTTAYPQAIRIA